MNSVVVRSKIVAILLALIFVSIPVPISAATSTDTYLDITATITAPDTVESNTNFTVTVTGGGVRDYSVSVFAYGFYENAVWTYDGNHKISVTSGTLLDGSGIKFGSNFTKNYILNKPAGTYKYTFFFGQRSFGHGWYDVALDVYVTVKEAGPKICDGGWRPPLSDVGNAGKVIPLKFTAYTCENDIKEFYRDENVILRVENATGSVVNSFTYTGNPHTGIDIDQVGKQYHVNWNTTKDMVGTYTIKVLFDSTVFLSRNITLQ